MACVKESNRKLVFKRQNLGDVDKWHPEISMRIN